MWFTCGSMCLQPPAIHANGTHCPAAKASSFSSRHPQADCQTSQLEAADAASTARARAVHCGKAAALATRGGVAVAAANGGSAVSQADGSAAAVTKSKPGSATAVAVAGPGGRAAGDARA